jgi:hypothetical protein
MGVDIFNRNLIEFSKLSIEIEKAFNWKIYNLIEVWKSLIFPLIPPTRNWKKKVNMK